MKRRLLAMAALTAVLLTACTQWDAQEPVIGIVDTDHEESTEPTEKNSENSVTNPPATPSKEMEETMSRVSVRVQTEQYDATDDDGALLCTVRLSVPTVTMEGRDAAQSAIQAVLDQMADQRRTEAEQVTDLARTDRPAMEQYTTFQGYGVTDSLDLGRLDSRTINLLWTTSDNTGGAHGNTMTTAFVFDAETGERLSLLDVAINTDALSMQLEEQVLQQMEQAPEQYFSEAQQWVIQLLEDGCWYFSEDGVVLLSNPGVLAPYSAGTLEFTATYEALQQCKADILVTHEAAGCHKKGFDAIDRLAKSLGVKWLFHGHQHEDCEYGVYKGMQVRAVGFRGIVDLNGRVVRPAEIDPRDILVMQQAGEEPSPDELDSVPFDYQEMLDRLKARDNGTDYPPSNVSRRPSRYFNRNGRNRYNRDQRQNGSEGNANKSKNQS